MKRILALLVCLAMFAVGTAMAYTEGKFTAQAPGNNGPVEVEVTFSQDKIVDIQVKNHGETAGISDTPIATIPEKIIATQSLAVDSVTGATNTSKAILAAVADCVKQAGGNPDAMMVEGSVENAPAEDEELTVDVVVIGGGAAGLAAAAEASDAGAKVLLLEKLPFLGGNTLICGGLVKAAGTTFQQEAGVEDSAKALADYWFERAEGNADRAQLDMVAEKSNDTILWLQAQGVELSSLSPSGTRQVPDMLNTGSGGNGFVAPVEKAVRERGVEIRTETPAVELIKDEAGAVAGVVAQAKDGHKVTVHAKGVVIASGGFDHNKEMKRKFAPSIADEISFSSIGNTGDGIRMAMDVGADTVFKDGAIGLRGIRPTSFADPLNRLVWNPLLLVSQKGERLFNESLDYPIYHSRMLEHGGGHFYLIFDASQANAEAIAALEAEGYAFSADSLEALAAKAFMEKDTFLKTVERYNELKGQEDADFGKAAALMTGVGEGPYHAVRIIPVTIGSMGGIKIDLDSRVLTPEGKPIPGLFAAGAVANGDFFYKEYPASGTSIMMCFTTGRIAGEKAAAK